MGQCAHTADNRNHPSERAVAQYHAPRRRGYIARRARCVTFGPDVRRSGPVRGGRTIRKRHVTERRRRTIARERRAHRHVPSRRSLLGPLLLYETAGPVKTHANRPNACIFRPSWTSSPSEWDSRHAERAAFAGVCIVGLKNRFQAESRQLIDSFENDVLYGVMKSCFV